MTKYLINRIIRSLVSIVIVIGIVMFMIYGLMDRNLIFAKDGQYTKTSNNLKKTYKYQTWEKYGYLDYVTYADYLQELLDNGEIDQATKDEAVSLGRTQEGDSEIVTEYVNKFKKYYEGKGYTVKRLNAVMASPRRVAAGGNQALFAYCDQNLLVRLGNYLKNLITIDDIDNV